MFCPSLLTGPLGTDLGLIMLQHRIYRSIPTPGFLFSQFRLEVSREHAFRESFTGPNQLHSAHAQVISLTWATVSFTGEDARGRGLVNEWFLEAAREIRDGLLELHPSGVYTVLDLENADTEMFALGRYIALAIVHGKPLGFRLSTALCGQLLGQVLSLEDMADQEPEIVRSLALMLEAQETELINDFGELHIPREGDVEITLANREDLVARRLRAMSGGFVQQVTRIVEGFRSILPLPQLRGITARNLGNILYGNPAIDVDELIRSIELGPGLAATDDHIQWLFETLRSYNNQQLSEFIRFARGNSLTPVGGFQALNPRITIRSISDVRRYPKSQTCFNLIFLPPYPTQAELREKLSEALANNGGMQE